MPYVLGAVAPHVRAAAEEIGSRFDVGTIYGVGWRTGASDHPSGYALDFMTYDDVAKGNAIVAYGMANATRLRVKYIMWQRRIWQGGEWRDVPDRGSRTANHEDHPHFSFVRSGPGVPSTTNVGLPGLPNIPNPVDAITERVNILWTTLQRFGDVLSWVTKFENLQRVSYTLAGGIFILIAFVSWDTVKSAVRKAT